MYTIMLCKYSKILGEPRKGVHKYRLCNIAIVDVLLTIALAAILDYVFADYGIGYWKLLLGLFLLAIFLHWLFCVKTTVNNLIFG